MNDNDDNDNDNAVWRVKRVQLGVFARLICQNRGGTRREEERDINKAKFKGYRGREDRRTMRQRGRWMECIITVVQVAVVSVQFGSSRRA